MPERRLQKTRSDLPRGYQFGQQGHEHEWVYVPMVGDMRCSRCQASKTFIEFTFNRPNAETPINDCR